MATSTLPGLFTLSPLFSSDWFRLCACALSLELCMLALNAMPADSVPVFLAIMGGAFWCYGVAVREVLVRPMAGARALRFILLSSLVMLFTAWLAPPRFDDDLYRYGWEGKVTLAGENPYLHPPADLELIELWRKDQYRIPYDTIPSIYPPLTQGLLAACAWTAPDSWPVLKAAFTLLFVGGLASIIALLRLLKRPPARVLIAAWSPLALKEVANSGHMDAALVLVLPLLTLALIRRKDALAILSLSAGILTKLMPVLLVPLVWARLRRPALILVLPLVFALAYLPFLEAGWALFEGLGIYARFWTFNHGPFAVLELVTAHVLIWLLGDPSVDAGPLARALPLLIAGTVALWAAWSARQRNSAQVNSTRVVQAMLWPTALLLLLSPTVDPWYLLWILPWLCVQPSPALLVWTGLSFLSYTYYIAEQDYPSLRLLEYALVVGLLLREWHLARKTGGALPAPSSSSASTEVAPELEVDGSSPVPRRSQSDTDRERQADRDPDQGDRR